MSELLTAMPSIWLLPEPEETAGLRSQSLILTLSVGGWGSVPGPHPPPPHTHAQTQTPDPPPRSTHTSLVSLQQRAKNFNEGPNQLLCRLQ